MVMKEEIYEKLNNMSNLEDRIILKSILNNVFLNLYEHSEEMYKKLEEKVFNEGEYSKFSYDIFATISRKKDVDPAHYFLYPMDFNDVEENKFNFKKIIREVAEEGRSIVFKVFLQCDHMLFKKIINKNKKYKGKIITDKRVYDTTFSLTQNRSYFKKIEELYEVFLKNNIPWKTINNPYISKFGDVVITEVFPDIDPEEEIKEITVDFEEFSKYVYYDMVPLWNIEKVQLKSVGFPTPCEDKINFEHNISLRESGVEHGYLSDYGEMDINRIVRREEELVITSTEEKSQTWNLLKIVTPKKDKTERYEYDLVSNSKRQSFVESFSNQTQQHIKTRAELMRIINSFEIGDFLHFEKIEIKEKFDHIEETYDVNFFIIDEIRDIDYKKIMVLYFKEVKKDYFITRDILSFIISEIQMFYPEYKCEGRII